MTKDQSIRVRIANAKGGVWQIADPETERQVLYLTDPGIALRGEAGGYMAAAFQVLPSLDITVEATLQYVCQYCWMPLEQALIIRYVRITSEGVAALFSNLTFTDLDSGQTLPFVAACDMSLASSLDRGPQATTLLTCVEIPSPDTRLSTTVPDGVCQRCERPLKEPHHKNCSCPPCRERKRQEHKALLEEELL